MSQFRSALVLVLLLHVSSLGVHVKGDVTSNSGGVGVSLQNEASDSQAPVLSSEHGLKQGPPSNTATVTTEAKGTDGNPVVPTKGTSTPHTAATTVENPEEPRGNTQVVDGSQTPADKKPDVKPTDIGGTPQSPTSDSGKNTVAPKSAKDKNDNLSALAKAKAAEVAAQKAYNDAKAKTVAAKKAMDAAETAGDKADADLKAANAKKDADAIKAAKLKAGKAIDVYLAAFDAHVKAEEEEKAAKVKVDVAEMALLVAQKAVDKDNGKTGATNTKGDDKAKDKDDTAADKDGKPATGVNKSTTLSATTISSTIPTVLITSVVFLYLYNW